MSHSIQLPSIDKEKLRELASQARADGAKRAQEASNLFPPADDVYFVEPVKVASTDPESDKIQKQLGSYEVAKKIILSSVGSKTDILGVDRQPATPLPSKEIKEAFFTKSSKNPYLVKRHASVASSFRKDKDKISYAVGQSERHREKVDDEMKEDRYSNKTSNTDTKHNILEKTSSSNKEECSVQAKESSYSSAKSVSSHNQISTASAKSQSHRHSNHSALFKSHTLGNKGASQSVKSGVLSLEKDTVKRSKLQPPERESILSTFDKEFSMNSSSFLNSASRSPTQKDEFVKPNKASANRPVDSSVLKVKEDNKNGINTSNGRVRPMLHMPEKNLEDMLKELTHIPQPLTALHTPQNEGEKFPFQVPDTVQLSQELKKTEIELLKEKELSSRSTSLDQIEPIASPNEEDSEDGLSDSDSEKALEEGEIQSEDSDDDVIAPARRNSSDKEYTSKVSHVVSVSTSKGTTAPVKEPRKSSRKMSSGSSESSSCSGSDESNNSDSDSEEDHILSEDDVNELKNEITPTKSKASPLEEEESPLSATKQKWSLKSFLPVESSVRGPSSVKSLDGPWSNKSDANHYIDDIDVQPVRPADQVISDDNPPSNKNPDDHDVCSKPVSDEFSPPSLPHKYPIMSPKLNDSDIQHKNQTLDASPQTPTNTNDTVKCGKRNSSVESPEIQEIISGQNARKSRKIPPMVLSSECSSSDDELDSDVNLSSQSTDFKLNKMPSKLLPKSPRKSLSVSKTDRLYKISKRKESKKDKLMIEKDSVRLKTEGRRSASKSSGCDKSDSDKSDLLSTPNAKLESDSIEKILDRFQPESLLSPIPNVPEKSRITNEMTSYRKDKSVSFKGSVSYHNGKPSVMVQIDLDLVRIHLNLGKCVPECKDLVNVAIYENRTSELKLESGGKLTAKENNSQSEGMCVSGRGEVTSQDTSAVVGNSSSCDKFLPSVKTSAMESFSTESIDNSESACVTQKVLCSKLPNHSSFDSLSFRPDAGAKKQPAASLSDFSGSTDRNSDSDNEDNRSVQLSPVAVQITQICVQDLDLKKRKPDSHRTEDFKRRKTATQLLHNSLSTDSTHEEKNVEEKEQEWNKGYVRYSKQRRHNSSSQHSTKSSLNQQVHSRKKVKLDPAKESISSSPADNPATVSLRQPIKSIELEPSVQVNGHSSQLSTPSSVTQSTEGNRTVVCPFWIRDQEERLEDANEYHVRAKKAKHQADAMESGLQQNILYLEAALCFIQSGCAMERNHKVAEAANFFKETHRFVVHNPHFRMPHDTETTDKAELKLAVLCLRVQSLLYLKMFLLKKTESLKLKRVLEDYHNKKCDCGCFYTFVDSYKSTKSASAQPRPPPSAPSPHQTWNRSTGTPSPMSPTPSPVGSVCSVGSAGSMNELTPSKSSNGTPGPVAPAGHVAIPQRIHSITQKYFTSTSYLVSCHELWDQADSAVTPDIKEFFAQLDMDCGRLTMQSSLLHLVRYVKHGLQLLKGS